MIELRVKAPPPRILQVSQWLRQHLASKFHEFKKEPLGDVIPEYMLGLVLVQCSLPCGLATVALSLVSCHCEAVRITGWDESTDISVEMALQNMAILSWSFEGA